LTRIIEIDADPIAKMQIFMTRHRSHRGDFHHLKTPFRTVRERRPYPANIRKNPETASADH
jgi:hypothetical protein